MSGLGDSPGKKAKRAPRINGPFQGRWKGALDFDLTVHDLSITGCLIESFHEVPAGRRMFEVPDEEVCALAEAQGLMAVHGSSRGDVLGRVDVRWSYLAFRRPPAE